MPRDHANPLHVPDGPLEIAACPGPPAVVGDAQTDGAVDHARLAARVLHIITGEHYAGAERVQDLLACRLPALGFEVGFACVKPDRFPELRRARQAPLYRSPMRTRFDLTAAWRIALVVRRQGYALVHGHTARTAMIGRLVARLAGVPLVYHVHSPTSRNTTRRVLNRVSSAVERRSLGGAARLIAVSESLARHMQEQGFAREKIAVVPNGVPAVAPLPERAAPQGRWTLGTVALFRPRKGIEMLLEAMALLRQQGHDARLRAVGTFESRDYERHVMARAARLGLDASIEWTGFARDVTAELARMDLFVLPSLFGEGMPMVILEAMAAGVPVVATEVEGAGEVIRNGRDGVLVAPGDPQQLAAGVARVLAGRLDWAALRAAALKRHAERFSDRAMAAGVADVYRSVLGCE